MQIFSLTSSALPKKIIPNYAKIKIPATSPASYKTQIELKLPESKKRLNSYIRKKTK